MFNNEKFNQSLKDYNSNAIIQNEIAKELIKLLPCNKYSNIFEIGCGSGFLTKEIVRNLQYESLVLNDIVDNSKEYIKNFSKYFILGDAEKIDFPKNLDLVISSSVFQWINDLSSFINKISYNLNENGILAFSMFTFDNFREIKDNFNITLNYKANEEIIKIINKNFNIFVYKEKENTLYFKKSIDILRHINLTGINVLKHQKLSKSKVFDFIKNNIITLTYKYNYVVATKK